MFYAEEVWFPSPGELQHNFKTGDIMEKRRFQRMGINNLVADISDGQGFFNGEVKDLSRYGIRLSEVPPRLDDHAKQLSVVVSSKKDHFKIQVRPRWSRKQAISKVLGLEIVSAPLGWAEFVIDQEAPFDEINAEITI